MFKTTYAQDGGFAHSFGENYGLVAYNHEDCDALKVVTEFLRSVTTRASGAAEDYLGDGIDLSIVEEGKRSFEWSWGKVDFHDANFAHVNKCAYFDYQRQRVYVRSNRRRTRASGGGKGRRKHNLSLRITKKRAITQRKCPKCGQHEARPIEAGGRRTVCPVPRTKRSYDLDLTPSSVKRRVLGFHTKVHQCKNCGHEFVPERHERLDRHSHSLKSFLMYLHVGCRMSMETASSVIEELFNVTVRVTDAHMIKGLMAQYYRHAYQKIHRRLVAGRLIHADETTLPIRQANGYVWVFTSLHDVLFVYRPTREGDFLQELLKSFDGVLVSDFYSAYDSLSCVHQKCLVHLIRDLNQAILASPYDQELQSVTKRFGNLLRAIVDSIERYGLSKNKLRRHKPAVSKFQCYLQLAPLRSEGSVAVRDRLLRSYSKLFAFLDHSGVPWNNNNAEHALKQIAYWRGRPTNAMNERGVSDYLTLLSVRETCRYRGVSFLRFMASGVKDVEVFCKTKRRRRRTQIPLYPPGFVPPALVGLRKRFGKHPSDDQTQPHDERGA